MLIIPALADLHYVDGTALTVQYLLVVDALNFCFWPGMCTWQRCSPVPSRMLDYLAVPVDTSHRSSVDLPGGAACPLASVKGSTAQQASRGP